jgi:hypothetical protein
MNNTVTTRNLLETWYNDYMTKTCSIPGCDKPVHGKGYCDYHYANFRRFGDPLRPRQRKKHLEKCSVAGCLRMASVKGLCSTHDWRMRNHGSLDLPAKTFAKNQLCTVEGCNKKQVARGYCGTHWKRWKKHGDPTISLPGRTKAQLTTIQHGYRRIYAPENPMSNSKGYVPEHRLVMSQMIGRPLNQNESVHHVNGDGLDNHPENLELWVTWQPSGQRPADLVAWANEILRLYGDMVK